MRRKMSAIGVVAVPLLAACGQPSTFAGPAPAGALACALAHGEAAGYVRVDGDAETGFVRLSQSVRTGPPDFPPDQPLPEEPGPRLRPERREPVENEILLEEDRGRLLITVLGINTEGVRIDAGSTANEQAQTMLALCTSDPPVLPSTAQR